MTDETPVLCDLTSDLQDRLVRAARALSQALSNAKRSDELRVALDRLRQVEGEIADHQRSWREWEVATRRSRLALVGRERRDP